MKQTLIESARVAGEILLGYFGKKFIVRSKGDPSSVVTDADLAAERDIIDRIRARFPDHSIVAEETGYQRQPSDFTWIIDPLDGTSNFAAGLSWFGVQIAVFEGAAPIMAVMYLPVERALYFSERGHGVSRNDQPVRVTAETDPRNVLCNFGLDSSADAEQTRREVELLHRVANAVRNVRATNSLVDFCYTLDGRLGGCVNLNAKIWDIAPLCLMLPEAGGRLTDIEGGVIRFRPEAEPFDRSYTVLGASAALHPQLLAAVRAPA